MRKAKYICVEGTDGVGKTTAVKVLVDSLRNQGARVLETKEPGTVHLPLTVDLRRIVLDAKYDEELTPLSRELILQAIRSIHYEKLILPSLDQYDYIVQDRGVLSSMAYGEGCGNSSHLLVNLIKGVFAPVNPFELYDLVIYLRRDPAHSLKLAQKAKQEFEAGDAMELKGPEFLANVAKAMEETLKQFSNYHIIDVENIDQTKRDLETALTRLK